jgi:hypothetical protein
MRALRRMQPGFLPGFSDTSAPPHTPRTAPDCPGLPQGGTPLQEPEELQLLRRRLDPELAPALAAGEAAPRLAVAVALYGLAKRLGVALRDEECGEGGGQWQARELEAPGGRGGNVAAPHRGDASRSSRVWERDARAAGAEFWRGLLEMVLTDPLLSMECLKPGSDVHRLLVGRRARARGGRAWCLVPLVLGHTSC